MPYSLNQTLTQIEAARIEFPKTGVRQFQYRYYAVFVGATGGEIFIDGNAAGLRRLGIPRACGVIVSYDMVCNEFVTATGATAGTFAAVNGKFAAEQNAAGVTAIGGSAVAATLIPAAQVVATVVPSANDTVDAIVFTINAGAAANTRVIEMIVNVVAANKGPVIAGLS